MPARKPTTIVTRSTTKAESAARAAADLALLPTTELPLDAPSALRGHKVAAATWKRIVGLYNEIDGKIATSFDHDLLIKYCLLEEEVLELAEIRVELKKQSESQIKAAEKFKPKADQIKDYVAMWQTVNALLQRFQGMDARLDGKRKLLLSLSQSLYLTPRSRAGVAPPVKEAEAPKSEIEKAIDGD